MKKPVLFPLKRYMFENKKLPFCNRLLFISFVIFGFYGTFNIAAYGKITRLYPTDDGYACEYGSGSGSWHILWVGYSTTNGNYRSFLKFDLSDIPEGSTINSATLRCHYHWYLTGGTSNARSISAHRADQYWHEGSMQWPGGGFAESYGSDSAGGGYQKWCSWNVTTLVQHWMNGTYPNYGITLKSTSEGGTETNVLGFESKEDGSNTPYLEIDYIPLTHACGGELIAWGQSNFIADGDDFVAVDSSVACGPTIVALRSNGSLWGSGVPGGSDFIAIAGACNAGYAIRSDGSLTAWGSGMAGMDDVPSGNNYVAVTGGGIGYYGLALKSDGEIACWGNEGIYGDCYGMCRDKPSSSFIAIDAGSCHNLALRANGTIVAWGNNYFGQCNVPSGTYVAIGAGRAHSVGLRIDGSIACWGTNSYGQCSAPSGNDFVAISVGDDHNIAQRADGSLVAWGNNSQGQCDMPVGSDFIAFCAGDDTSLVIVREPTIIYRSGSAVNQWAEASPAYSLEDSIFERGIVLGNGIYPATPTYFFYLPEKTTPAGQIEWISVSIDGDNAWLSWPEAYIGTDSNPTSLRDSGTTTYTQSGAAARDVLVDANDNVGSLLTVQIDVGSWTDRYDLNDIVATYLYSGADYDTLSNFQMAYCGYRAINNFKTDIVEDTWGLAGTTSEEIINKAVQRTGAFCQNLLGLDGNVFQAVKSFFASLEAFESLAWDIYDYSDFIVFWVNWPIEFPYDYPSLEKIKDNCNSAATACADLAIAYQDLAFDGIDSSEYEPILDAIDNAKAELEALKSTLQSAASHMNTEYHNGGLGSQSAKLSKQSMSPMMRYEPNSITLYESYLPNLIADINEQANQFVTVDFDISPSDKGLYITVDGDPCDSHRTFVWLTGHSHTIGAPLTQTGGDGYVYEFDSWSDGGNSTHEIIPTSDETYTVTYTVDNQPPTPNPMSWENEPNAISATAITMTATEASDPEGNGVQYYFECTSGGGHSSSWQDERTYTDNGIQPNTTYTYIVKARDKSLNAELNTTSPSSPISATTYRIADFDTSGLVEFEDLRILANQWLQPPGTPSADIAPWPNVDGFVNFLDFAILAKDWLSVAMPVANVNQAPELDPIGDKAVDENSTLTFAVNATDPDGDAIVYSVQDLPAGATFNSQIFSWTPTYTQAGTYQITFYVSDGQLQDAETITIAVNNVDREPTI